MYELVGKAAMPDSEQDTKANNTVIFHTLVRHET